MTEPDAERPPESSQADVTLVARGITVTACVEVSSTHTLVVRPIGEGKSWKTSLEHGTRVEVYWVGGHEERTLPATISEIDTEEEPRWHLSVTGPATRSQRRKAVRAAVALDVLIPWAGAHLAGRTVDLSEAGMRAVVDGWGLPPEPGAAVRVSLTLADAVLDLRGEVVWAVIRGAQWHLAVRFDDIPENEADLLRRRVFQALREERARAAD